MTAPRRIVEELIRNCESKSMGQAVLELGSATSPPLSMTSKKALDENLATIAAGERRCSMKTYTVTFAQVHSALRLRRNRSQKRRGRLRRAKKYWRDVNTGAEQWPLNDAQHDSAVSARIVLIYDEADKRREIAHDVRLDEYTLMRARTARDQRTLDNAKAIFKALI